MGCGCGGSRRPGRIVAGRRPKTAIKPKTTAATVPRTLAQRTQSKSSTNQAMGKLSIQRKRKAAIRRALGRP